jgi:hypothetical protein
MDFCLGQRLPACNSIDGAAGRRSSAAGRNIRVGKSRSHEENVGGIKFYDFFLVRPSGVPAALAVRDSKTGGPHRSL